MSKHHKPARPKITKEQRRKASDDQARCFLGSYFVDWRLTQVLTLGKLVQQRHTFYTDLIDQVKTPDDPTGGSTIAQEIHNGLHFEAIAHCVQYVEDLFALIEAAKEPDYFIKRIVTYNAGSITNRIRGFEPWQGVPSQTCAAVCPRSRGFCEAMADDPAPPGAEL